MIRNKTICFFQPVKAQHEVNEWEKLQQESIVEKTTITYHGKKIIRFLIRKKLYEEVLYCIPYDIDIDVKLMNFILELDKRHRYVKTLFFGEIDITVCTDIQSFLIKIEKFRKI